MKKMTEKTEEISDEQADEVTNKKATAKNKASEKETASESKEASDAENKEDIEEIPSLEDQLADSKDRYLRIYSEFENFRRRTAKEKLELINSAGKEVITDLLPVIDDMDRAIATFDSANDVEALKEGFNLVHNKLVNILTQKGLQPMNAKETEFNVDMHEAITKIPAPSPDLKGKVVDVVEKGYYINDKVVRFAKVVIGE